MCAKDDALFDLQKSPTQSTYLTLLRMMQPKSAKDDALKSAKDDAPKSAKDDAPKIC